ncbi:MAG: thioredoxin family protein [Nitrospirota bacterium]|nr:thioredoxin family protein [Nitrospirota bacterium]
MGGTVEEVSDANYEEFMQAPAAVVAYGIASCEPCNEYDPILEQTAAQLPNIRIGKAKMHVPGRCREIKKQHQFETYPTTHLFSKGKLLLTREGKIQADELAALINDYLLKS